jgi:hypothetical protein
MFVCLLDYPAVAQIVKHIVQITGSTVVQGLTTILVANLLLTLGSKLTHHVLPTPDNKP